MRFIVFLFFLSHFDVYHGQSICFWPIMLFNEPAISNIQVPQYVNIFDLFGPTCSVNFSMAFFSLKAEIFFFSICEMVLDSHPYVAAGGMYALRILTFICLLVLYNRLQVLFSLWLATASPLLTSVQQSPL